METEFAATVTRYEDHNVYVNLNYSCDDGYVPTAIQLLESLGAFGTISIVASTFLVAATIYLAGDASYNVFQQKDTRYYKTNSFLILMVFPVTGVCSLVALAVPRAQLLSEAVVQISLTISLYRLYLLLIDVGCRKITKPPALMLRVGPCCCWPCLPFPSLELTDANLCWLRILVLQLPVVQGVIYCILLFISAEEPIFVTSYSPFFQPFVVISILVGLYGLTITTMSLDNVAPEAKLRHKARVSQMVLLFSKLQGFIIKSLSSTGLFPCNPPISPLTYANVTYNILMVIEMLMLSYVARSLYINDEEDDQADTTDRNKDKIESVVVTNNENR